MAECKKFKRDYDARGLSETTHSSLEQANAIQEELDGVSRSMSRKILEVIQEFAGQKKPLYDKRHAILRSIPNFWGIAFTNHPKLKLLVNSSIEDCLHYLQYIDVIENDVRSGYQIFFLFDTNPYFYNSKLVKVFDSEGEGYVTRKTSIDWKDNMNLCNDDKKLALQARKRSAPLENFFDWLARSSSNDIVCDIIKDDLWVDPLKYFFLTDEGNEESDCEISESDDEELDDFLDAKDDSSEEDESNTSEIDDKPI